MYDDWTQKVRAAGYNPEPIMALYQKWADFYNKPANVQEVREKAKALPVFQGAFPAGY
jgi:hypothetical protein